MEYLSLQRGNHGGLVIRFPDDWVPDLLNSWSDVAKFLNDWGAVRRFIHREPAAPEMDPGRVHAVLHNGMMQGGMCPYHKIQHLEILPIGQAPMLCHEAVVLMAKQEKEVRAR